MPQYTFEDTKNGREFDLFMTMAKKEDYLKNNTHIRQVISKVNIVAGVSGMSYRQDQGWKEALSRVAEKHPIIYLYLLYLNCIHVFLYMLYIIIFVFHF